jgi:hypothetical protein
MVGSYQCDDYNQILLNVHSNITNEWDLLRYLAKVEGFQLFVDGTTLVFTPAETLPMVNRSINANDVTALIFHNICPTSDLTTLTAKSWNSWLGQALIRTNDQSTSQSVTSPPALSTDPGTEIAIVRPNMSSKDAERLLSQYLNALNEQAVTVQITMPGELSLKSGDALTVTAGNGIFNGSYIVKSVRRRFSSTAGFVQHVQGHLMTDGVLPSVGAGVLSDG